MQIGLEKYIFSSIRQIQVNSVDTQPHVFQINEKQVCNQLINCNFSSKDFKQLKKFQVFLEDFQLIVPV